MKSPFHMALGADFGRLPAALRQFHSSDGPHQFLGRVSVEHGRGILPAIATKLGGFPPPCADTSMSITVTPHPKGERWLRMFGRHKTTSNLRYDKNTATVIERFGMIRCALVLALENGTLNVQVQQASLLGIVLPSIFSPRSVSREWQDDQGRFCFDIAAFLGRDRLLIRYSGWLEPDPRTTL
jgi:hypothetical protein